MNRTQQGVLSRIAVALLITLIGLGSADYLLPPLTLASQSAKLAYTASWDLLIVLCLLLNIGALARHRFFSAEDIDGDASNSATDKARRLQSMLQNTLEQTVLALACHSGWAILMPAQRMAVVPVAVLLFLVGRSLFWFGYRRGAVYRALGFGLTFYPSVMLLVALLLSCLSMLGS